MLYVTFLSYNSEYEY